MSTTLYMVVRATDDPSEWCADRREMLLADARELAEQCNAGPDGPVVGSGCASYHVLPVAEVVLHDGREWPLHEITSCGDGSPGDGQGDTR